MYISRDDRIDQLVVKAQSNAPAAVNLIEKAAAIVKAGGVTFREDRPDSFLAGIGDKKFVANVNSQTRRYPHQIFSEPGGLTCTCEFFQRGNGRRPELNGQPLCTHIVAASMEDKLREDMGKIKAAASKRPYTPRAWTHPVLGRTFLTPDQAEEVAAAQIARERRKASRRRETAAAIAADDAATRRYWNSAEGARRYVIMAAANGRIAAKANSKLHQKQTQARGAATDPAAEANAIFFD